MPYTWNPATGGFTWTTPAGGAIMSGLAPDLTAPQAWELAAQQAQPGYAARPGLAPFMQEAYAPTYGQWLMTARAGTEPGIPSTPFQDWLMGPQGEDPTTGDPTYATNPRFGSASIAPPTTTPEGWANLVGIARAMSPVYGGDFGGKTNLTQMPGYENWIDILGDPRQTEALTAMAMYDPAAGSLLGRMRGRGQARRMADIGATRPGMTPADWLGYVTGQPGMTTAAYQV